MTESKQDQWMRVMRVAVPLLKQRGRCGKWVPMQTVVCARHAGHTPPCERA
jgi:hypothetical protein